MRLHVVGFKRDDVVVVVVFDHVQRFVQSLRVQCGDHECVWIPFDHDVRVVGEPNCALRRWCAVLVFEYLVVPFLVGGRAGFGELVKYADGLHAVMLTKLPCEVVTGDEAA